MIFLNFLNLAHIYKDYKVQKIFNENFNEINIESLDY